MKIKNLTLFLQFILLFLLGGCKSTQAIWMEENPVKQMVFDHAKRQKNRYGLELVAMEIPREGKRKPFYIHFCSLEKREIPEVRKILIDIAESFLRTANANEMLKESLDDCPLTVEEITVNIGFLQVDGSFHEPPFVAYAYVKEGHIHYCYYDNLFGKFIQYDDVKESFQTAKLTISEANL